jgi:DNA-binding beta-propeller fold protein YncE
MSIRDQRCSEYPQCSRYRRARRVARVVLGASLLYAGAALAAGPTYVTQWGGSGIGRGILHDPPAVAVDGAGNVYVVDRGHDQIVKFDNGGNELARWGSAGSGQGQFDWPVGIAVDGFGDVDVVDTGNDRIEQFSPDGTFLREWGSFGAGPGQFDHPLGIAADPGGDVFVTDTGNDRIEVFGILGTFSAAFGGSGTGPGQFDQPIGIAIDPTNSTLYVVDSANHRVEHFDEGGGFRDAWGTFGDGPATFRNPNGIAIDGNGTLCVTDHDDDRIEEFTRLGTFIDMFGSFGLGDAEFVSPEGIAATAQGLVYVADTRNDRVEEFTVAAPTPPQPPALVTMWGGSGTGPGQFDPAEAIATDPSSGTVLVVDAGTAEGDHARVERFDGNGAFLGEFALAHGEYGTVRTLAVDGSTGDNYVWSSDTSGITQFSEIERYARDGTPLGVFGALGTGPGQFSGVVGGLALDSMGNVYVADSGSRRVVVFSHTGASLGQWGVGADVDQMGGLAIDASDRVYVVVSRGGTRSFRRFTTDGAFLDEVAFGGPSVGGDSPLAIDGAGDLLASQSSPVGVFTPRGEFITSFGNGNRFSVDTAGDVYVLDFFDHVEKYAPPPTLVATAPGFVRTWGTLAGIGAFQDPAPAALAPSGNLYVVNLSDPELGIEYAPDGTVITAFGGSGTGPGQFREPSDLAVALTGDVYVTDYPDRIEQFTADGQFLRQWLAFGDGNPNSGVSSVAGIAVDDGGDVFVVNTGTLKVEEFDATGTPITQWSIQTTDPFDACPDGLAFDPGSGDLWLVDDCLFLVQEYRTDGTFVSQFGSKGSAPGQFLALERIVADGRGHLFVPDAGNERIDEFDTLGNLISEWGTFGVMPGQLDEPRGIAVTPTGRIYVVEEDGARVQVFQGAAPAGDHLVLTAPAAAAAGVPFTITVTAESAAGQPLGAYRGTVHFTSSDAAASLPADYTFRKSDRGTHEFQVTLDTVSAAGTQTISVVGSQLTQGDASASIALFASDTGASVVVEGGASVATASPPTPGPGHPLVVTLTSPQGGPVSFTSTSGGAAPPGFSALGVGMVITAPPGDHLAAAAARVRARRVVAPGRHAAVERRRLPRRRGDRRLHRPRRRGRQPRPLRLVARAGGQRAHAHRAHVARVHLECRGSVRRLRFQRPGGDEDRRPQGRGADRQEARADPQRNGPGPEPKPACRDDRGPDGPREPGPADGPVAGILPVARGGAPSGEEAEQLSRDAQVEGDALSVPFDVEFVCANDPLKGAGHEDVLHGPRRSHGHRWRRRARARRRLPAKRPGRGTH